MTNTRVEQFIPKVYDGDIQRVVYRDFPPKQHTQILQLIASSPMRGNVRIVLACLKVAKSNIQTLKEKLWDASGYWREIISEAEYPNYNAKATHIVRLSESEQRAIIELDKSQYLEWLNKR